MFGYNTVKVREMIIKNNREEKTAVSVENKIKPVKKQERIFTRDEVNKIISAEKKKERKAVEKEYESRRKVIEEIINQYKEELEVYQLIQNLNRRKNLISALLEMVQIDQKIKKVKTS